MTFLAFLPKPTQVINISGATNNVNLRTQAGSPAYPLNLLAFINSAVGSTSTATPALDTGTGWTGGTFIFVQNNGEIIISE
jgi:hypothetical protein